MINTIDLNAFKSFPSQTINLKPMTLLAGINSSGKSSVIQALRMFCSASEGNSPLLDGHGPVSEIHSKLSSQNESIKITCHYENNKVSSLELNRSSHSKPDFAPICCYVGADRLGPQASLPLSRSLGLSPQIGDKGEYVLDFLEKLNDAVLPEALVHEKSEGKTLKHVVSGWLNEISPGVKFNFHTSSKTDSAHSEIDGFRSANVGFGLSYTLPIITAVLGMSAKPPPEGLSEEWWEVLGEDWEEKKKNNGVLVILENPEAHLHPHGQTAMGKLIAIAASCGIQMIVETHSDHLMDGIRIAVKENLVSADKIAFQYFTKNDSGITDVVSPKLHDDGKLDYWPEGFFDQTMKNRAILARK